MRKYLKLFLILFLITSFSTKISSKELTSGLVLNLSQSDSMDASQIIGLEWVQHFRNQKDPNSNLVPGWGFGWQQQNWGSADLSRLALSLSLNKYLDGSGWLESWNYIGLKWSIYTGMGQTGDALDCLQCSDVWEDYSGNEAYLTIGLERMQIALRITNNGSSYSEEAWDPWGVGGSWEDSHTGIPDPEIILNWFVF